jgi:phage gpG-like protein
MAVRRDFPKPSWTTIAAAVVGGPGGLTGLRPGVMVSIDATGEFLGGSAIDAAKIDKLGMSFKSFREPLTEALNGVLIPAIKQNFAEQGRPPWKKLTQRTLQNRLYEGFQRGPILDKTGRLKREAARKNNWDIRANTIVFRGVYFTQKVSYAGYHQNGALTMPARPFIQMTEADEVEIYGIFVSFLEKKVEKYWGRGDSL